MAATALEPAAPPLALTLLTLGVADLPRATAFYEALGLKRRARSYEGVAFFDANGAVLGLWPRPALADDAQVPDTAPAAFSGIALACNVASEGEVDALLTRAAGLGGRVTKPGQKTFWGGYAGYFADLDGHLWEVAFNPSVPFDAAGRLVMPE